MTSESPRNRGAQRSSSSRTSRRGESPPKKHWLIRAVFWLVGLVAAGAAIAAAVVVVAVATIYPQLPDVSDLADYRPKLPLRVYSAEGALIGEFGEERRKLTPIEDIPKVMKDALLSAEDSRFYEHSGIDYRGLARAALMNLKDFRSQGASTISMQVARNMYLSSERTFTRKLYEVLLTFKMEHLLSKDEILEIYMNQIFLGNRAHGFSAASEVYFGKPLEEITVAEAAMLAGLPVAPSLYNPIRRPERARIRQLHIINRMLENGYITAEQAQQARADADKPYVRRAGSTFPVRAEFVAEMVRQAMVERYGEEANTRGLNVYTTIQLSDQEAAYQALRTGIMNYEKRQHYRGPENFVNLPDDATEQEEVIDKALAAHPDNGQLLSAVVLEASRQKVTVIRADGTTITITGDGLKPVQSGLADKATANIKIRRGAIVRILKTSKDDWELTQLPEVEGAFVALESDTGAIRALVGGFDFNKNKFNHVTQAVRQTGSAFKPFIYSAALEEGFSPATIIADAPIVFSAAVTGSKAWEPRNYDRKFDGPLSMRTSLARSKNIASVRLTQAIGPKKAQEWATRFGFDASRIIPVLPMALGSGEATPLQMATAFAVFANGGHRVDPWLIERVTDYRGRVLSETKAKPIEQMPQSIDPRNAFITSSLLQEVVRAGTGARARNALKRPDLYGKTGTTNDAYDAWFAGFQPSLTAVAWVGYDNPRDLGSRETGGGLALPIWVDFMRHALKDIPIAEIKPPAGVTRADGDWTYTENSGGRGIASLGMESLYGEATGTVTAPSSEERARIMDLFRN
ncbi:penicillin-binding protein 1A [Lampropedia aestuarii]|uniref:Penicillin-binding protein 1A n=1 Tax=Lampropedia aestuarii TaxID=2562762 RepID=A0A4S5C249_9BURK|nr:penicillin-binding protein 1A [Lampropedia aestuarii]THJ36538.1 penicillin-binding protein 1A [Lampropedia aestuarii]